MKTSRLTMFSLTTGLTLASLTVAFPASAAAPGDTPDKPVIVDAAGGSVDYHTYTDSDGNDFQAGVSETSDRTQGFRVEVPSPLTRTERLTIREVGGRDLCQSRVALPSATEGTSVFSCSASTPIDYGDTTVEAVLTSAEGESVSDSVEILALLPDPTISIDSFDGATNTAHLSLTGLPGSEYTVSTRNAPVTVTGTIPESGSWKLDVPDSERGIWYSVNTIYRSVMAHGQVYIENDDPVATPAVTSVETEGVRTRVTLESPEDALIQVRNAKGNLVAAANDEGDTTLLEFLTPLDTEAHYSVTAKAHDIESAPVALVVNEGRGNAVPDAPDLRSVDMSHARPVVTLDGTPGTVMTVVDPDGRTVAVKTVPVSGHTQISLPAGSSRSASQTFYTARVSTSSAQSALTPIPIPAA